METLKINLIYVLLALVSFGCGSVNNNTNDFKYMLTQSHGIKTELYYSLSELEYMNNGCVKFLGFSYGQIDTTVVCGSFSVERYK